MNRRRTNPSRARAFTLIELLVVIGIMALIAAIAAPSLRKMKETDVMAAANRQLLDDVASARQRAIVGHTTVFMVFMPPVLDPSLYAGLPVADPRSQTILAHQQTSYAMFVHRTVGDQPGQPHPAYLTDWRSLPEGVFIPTWKFTNLVNCFQYTTNIPIPTLNGPVGMPVPYIAFDYQGRLLTTNELEFIPLARGYVDYQKDVSAGLLAWAPVEVTEEPPWNSISNWNRIRIDRPTGRATLERPEIR